MFKKSVIDLSIIIVNYNTFDLTSSCIQSIYKYTEGINFEIILVDNASDEKSPDEFLIPFPNIHLIKSDKNIGFAKGNNLAISKAKAKTILLLNSDTELTDNAIKKAYDCLNLDSKVGVVSSKLLFPNGEHQSVCQRFPSVRLQLLEFLRLHKLFTKEKAGSILLGAFFKHDKDLIVDWVWGAFFMFKSEILNKLPQQKLNDIFFMYGEDMQWCWDINKINYKIKYCSSAQLIHHMGGSNGEKEKYLKRNYQLFLKKNYNVFHRGIILLLNRLLKIF